MVYTADEPDGEARGAGNPCVSRDRGLDAHLAEDHDTGAGPGRRTQRHEYAGSGAEPGGTLATGNPGGGAGRQRLRPAFRAGSMRCDLARVCAILARVRACSLRAYSLRRGRTWGTS